MDGKGVRPSGGNEDDIRQSSEVCVCVCVCWEWVGVNLSGCAVAHKSNPFSEGSLAVRAGDDKNFW